MGKSSAARIARDIRAMLELPIVSNNDEHSPPQGSPKEEVSTPIESVPLVGTLPTRLDLRALYPQSIRLAFAESFPYLLGFVLVFAVYVGFLFEYHVDGAPSPIIDAAEFALRYAFYVALSVAGVKLLYELLCFLLYRYAVELEHLSIVRGVLFRSRTAFPIARINDVSLHRTPIEILFGLYTLTILTASPVSNFGSIEGLTGTSARALQAYLLALVETTLPDVRGKLAKNVLEQTATESATVAAA